MSDETDLHPDQTAADAHFESTKQSSAEIWHRAPGAKFLLTLRLQFHTVFFLIMISAIFLLC